MGSMGHRYLVPAIVVAATAGVYWAVLGHDFLNWDEKFHILDNQYYHPVTLSRLLHFWRAPFEGMYIPVVYTIWGAVAAFARNAPQPDGTLGLNPLPFHAANLVVHLLNVLLAYAILHRLVRRPWAAGAGAMLFAVHPLQAEPVAWVAGMKDLSGGLFSLLALWLYLAAVQGEKPRRARLLYAAASAAYLLALLAKPSSTSVPLIAFALDRWILKRPTRDGLRALLPWAAVAVPILLVTRQAQWFAYTTPVWARPFVAGDALAFYVAKLVWPLGLCADYGRAPQKVLAHTWGYLAWLLPAGLALLAWRGRARRPELTAAFALFVAGLLPVLGFVPFIFQNTSTVADRYVYLAMLGPALALSYLASRAESRALPLAAGAALLTLACLSAFQTLRWTNSSTLWTYTIQRNPGSSVAYLNMGAQLQYEHKLDDALACYEEALKRNPNSPESQTNIGYILAMRGDLGGARRYYEAAIASASDFAMARTNLASVLVKMGQPEDAARQCRTVLGEQPDNANARINLAVALEALGRAPEALPHAEAAVQLQPYNAEAQFNLGNIFLSVGRPADAAERYRRVIALEPKMAGAHGNLGAALEAIGDLDGAIRELQTAVEMMDVPQARLSLAQLLERRGRTAEAAEQYRRLLAAAPPTSPERQMLQQALARLGQAAPGNRGQGAPRNP